MLPVAVLLCAAVATAGDWPQHGYDAARTSASPHALDDDLQLRWTRELLPPAPAWPPSQHQVQYDVSYTPIVLGKSLFIASMVADRVTAYDTETGDERWRFYTDGPVRFAPVAYDGKVAFASDDGSLYCLDAADGKLLWRVEGAPLKRQIIGNDRLVSMWTARGGPVLHEGTIYFGSGIWPFAGTFLYAVDSETGEVRWSNSSSGMNWMQQPHSGAVSFSGVTPQGYIAACESRLIVPTGRSVPAGFDPQTGEMLFFHQAAGKQDGGADATILGKTYVNGGQQYWTETGQSLKPAKKKGGKGKSKPKPKAAPAPPPEKPWQADAPGMLIKAGDIAYGVTTNGIVESSAGTTAGKIEGEAWRMAAGDGKLFVTTTDGKLFCFGSGEAPPVHHQAVTRNLAQKDDGWTESVKKALAQCSDQEGYAVAVGIGSGRAILELLRHSEMHVIAIDPDERKVETLRRIMDSAGLYGRRFVAQVGTAETAALPPYLATLLVSETALPESQETGTEKTGLYRVLRPYGGIACQLSADGSTQVAATCRGPLPGSAPWTHQYGDAGNSVVSQDDRVKLPLGLLWFGGPPNDPVLPRHGHGPQPQVVGGRLFIEGENMLRAVDVYTGRLLWEKSLPGIGFYYRHTIHHPGANEIGSNYVSLPDAVYIASPERCYVLDPATGETLRTIKLPGDEDTQPRWGVLRAWEDLLIVAAAPIEVDLKKPLPPLEKPLIKRNTEWKYLVGTPATGGWNTPTFDTSDWKTGIAGFGYGDKLEKTTLSKHKKRTVVYIRKAFQVSNPKEIKKLSLGINYDDAFVAYLNGKEVARKGVTGRGASATKVVSHEAKGHETFPIPTPAARLRKGTNVLAIEGHNVKPTSSDFLLDPYLSIPGVTNAPLSSGKRFLSLMGLLDSPAGDRYAASSHKLMVLDRHSGEVLWSRDAAYNFRHNAIAVANGKIFCLDSVTAPRLARFRRRGFDPQEPPALYALDARTGKIAWEAKSDVFGTWLGYSAKHDVIVQAGSAFRDRARDEVGQGIVVYRAATGEVVWKDLQAKYGGPLILWRDEIITNGNDGMGLDLMTGKPTGWQWSRKYGCNTAIAGQHLLTFRSGAAGYYDLATRSGTGNLGGFKSSCTANLIPADGVLNAPDYTRTCVCSYQNQSSLALVHMPDMEMWTFGGQPAEDGSQGFNFGAPGERRSPRGTLWKPISESGTEGVTVNATADFRQHAMLLEGEDLPWVAASGLRGITSLAVTAPAGTYTVKLYFAEPEKAKEGERVFDVSLQGEPVLQDFDVRQAAGAPNRVLTRQFEDTAVEESVELSFVAKQGEPILCGLELIPRQP